MSADVDDDDEERDKLIKETLAALLSSRPAVFKNFMRRSRRRRARVTRVGNRINTTTIPRVRKSVTQVWQEQGDVFFRRAFRMSFQCFKKLYNIVKEELEWEVDLSEALNEEAVPNGLIANTVRLAAALRFFAGGAIYDIQAIFGISYSAVLESIECVVAAVNSCKCLDIKFPTSHDAQRTIADKFKKKSRVGFDCCVGCIDGMLIWTHKPTKSDCKEMKIGSAKFWCGRKNKYGMNLQAVCDSDKRFLYIGIQYGASASDLLAFNVSDLKAKLEKEGFLAPGLCLLGDNAYINAFFMATPYPNVSVLLFFVYIMEYFFWCLWKLS